MNAKIINVKSDVVISMSWEQAKMLMSLSSENGTNELYTFTDELEATIKLADQVRDMDLPGTTEFMVTAESGGMAFGHMMNWNGGAVQHMTGKKEVAIFCVQEAIQQWAISGMKDHLEVSISEGPDEFLIDEYGCLREGFYWSQVIESPFKIQAAKNTTARTI